MSVNVCTPVKSHPLCDRGVETYFLKVELLIHALMGCCWDCALTIEAQRNLMELRHGPIFVMWLDGPGTFVLLHPSICVGWTDPSQESPNRLFALARSIYLLHPSCHSFLTLVNLLIFLHLINPFVVYFCFVWFCFFSLSLDSPFTSSSCSFPAIMWVECVQKHTHTNKISIALTY